MNTIKQNVTDNNYLDDNHHLEQFYADSTNIQTYNDPT